MSWKAKRMNTLKRLLLNAALFAVSLAALLPAVALAALLALALLGKFTR